MNDTVCFRGFQERDIDFVYKCKNDEELNRMIVGQFKPLNYEDAVKWVHGCMQDSPHFKFWAVCTNDDEKRIVGWVSLSQIDMDNRSACHHGIVIGDKEYRDGTAMFETMLFSMEYAFDILHLNRLYGSCLSDHKTSPHMLNALGFTLEGTLRESVFKNGRYHDELFYAMLKSEYLARKDSGSFDVNSLILAFVRSMKLSNKNK